MTGPASLSRLPKPALFALFGALGGLAGALALGEPVWHLLRPPLRPVTVPAPRPQVAVTAPPHVALYPESKSAFGVQVARDQFTGPVTVRFEKLPPGVTIPDVLVPEGATAGTAEISATDEAAAGTVRLTATATATADGAPVTAKLDRPIEVQVIPLPPAPPRLAISVPPKIPVYQRGKNTFAVQVARGGFAGEVEVAFEDLPDGTAAPGIVFPAARSEVGVDLHAGATAKPGAHQVKVTARAAAAGRQLQASAVTTVDVMSPPQVPVDIVFALDISGSMQWAIDGTSRGIQSFVDDLARNQFDVRVGLVGFRDTTLGQPLKVVKVDGAKMTGEFAKFRAEVGKLKANGGGAEGESSLDGVAEAAEFPFRNKVTRVIVLVTDEGPKRPDGRMKSIEETAGLVKEKKIGQLHVVTLPNLKKDFEPLWEGAKGSYFDLKALNEGAESFEKLLPDVSKAIADLVADRPTKAPELPALAPPPKLPDALAARPAVTPAQEPEKPTIAPLEVKSLQSSERSAAGTEGRQVLRSGLWTGAVAAFVCAAILAGQGRYLRNRIPLAAVALGLAGGLAVGFVGGAAGQGLFLLAKTDNAAVGALFRVTGWALLGGLAGAGLSLFVPNLGARPGLLGGLVGGGAGAVGYLAVSAIAADAAGRLVGGGVLGAAIGLMVALAEVAFRRAWLEVRLTECEVVTVTLGPEPVRVGGEAKTCTVWARGAAPVALQFFVRDKKVICGDVLNRTESAVGNGFTRAVGSVAVVVRTGDSPAPPAPAPQPRRQPTADEDWDPLPLPVAPAPRAEPAPRPLDLDEAPRPLSAPAKPPVPKPPVPKSGPPARPPAPKPNIAAAPKVGECCPGCGRAIPGARNNRYCMVCDLTF